MKIFFTIRTNVKANYALYISSFTPQLGSLRGGTIIEINGEGFNINCSLNRVTFNPDSYNCQIISCTENQIKCRTSNAFTTYEVTNAAYNNSKYEKY